MPDKIYSIFDFDFVVTRKHTFNTYSIEHFFDPNTHTPISHTEDIFLLAQQIAETKALLKTNIEYYLKHDSEHLSAIASYHNNPAFIAGIVSKILNRNLTYQETIDSNITGTAIDIYRVEGIDTPFFISYIAGTYDQFNKTMQALRKTGKNAQINSLRRILFDKGFIESNSIFNYYDDTDTNVKNATSLKLTNCFLIDRENPTFTITEHFLCAEQLAAEQSATESKNKKIPEPPPVIKKKPQTQAMKQIGNEAILSKTTQTQPHIAKSDIASPMLDEKTLRDSLAKLQGLTIIDSAESIQPLLSKLVKTIENSIEPSNLQMLQDIVDKTRQLLEDSESSLSEYRAFADTLQGKPNTRLLALGTAMLELCSAISILYLAAALAGFPVVSTFVLVPTVTIAATSFIIGNYGLFAGRKKGLYEKLHTIADTTEGNRERKNTPQQR